MHDFSGFAVLYLAPGLGSCPKFDGASYKIEVLGFSASSASHRLLAGFFDDAIVFGLSEEVTEKTIELRKQHKIKLPDAIIAATALVNRCTLITRNTADFKAILELPVIDPHNI